MSVRLLCAVTAAAVLAALALAAGVPGVVYALAYGLALIPGLPLGIALFGRKHPAAWVCGALLGYGLTQLALWAVIVAGAASTAGFLAAWGLLCGLTFLLARRLGSGALIPMPAWTASDSRALLLVILLAPALMAPPYRESRSRGCLRPALLPRLFHRRLRLAQRARATSSASSRCRRATPTSRRGR